MSNDKFVTVLQAVDAVLVDTVTATLDAEGIPYQIPGRNHAAMLPGMMLITIEVRVPAARLADASALVLSVTAPKNERLVAFRLHRNYRFLGALIPGVAGYFWLMMNVALSRSQVLPLGIVGILIYAGFLTGRALARLSCSLPGCMGKLRPSDARCQKCGAEIRGDVTTQREHFSALERLSELSNDAT